MKQKKTKRLLAAAAALAGILLPGTAGLVKAEEPAAQEEVTQAVEAYEEAAEEAALVSGEVLVMCRQDVSQDEIGALVEEKNGESLETVTETEMGPVVSVDIPEGMSEEDAAKAYQEDDRVIAATPNYEMELFRDSAAVNDSDYALQLYLQQTEAARGWSGLGKVPHQKVKVAVLDTGADISHPDLSNIINLSDSCEILNDLGDTGPLKGDGYADGIPAFGSGHGTLVAGALAAEANNGQGIAGTGSCLDNSVVDLMVIDVFAKGNRTTLARVIQGMEHAKKAGAKVINLSLGMQKYGQDDSLLEAECESLKNCGIILVCAAGNYGYGDNGNVTVVPADYDSTIGVIALNGGSRRLASSNYGTRKILSAPGEKIYSTTLGGGYGVESGTSMAAPIVTAAIAMMCSVNPYLTEEEASQILQRTATDVGEEGFDAETAAGLLNVRRAMEAVIPEEQLKAALPYVDVRDGDWYQDGAERMYRYGIMTGLSPEVFGPMDTVSRAQFATMLYRYAGEPDTDGKTKFPDVAAGTFYTDAVAWAASQNVIQGYENGDFGSTDLVTREQMAVLLYRYVQGKGYAAGTQADLASYPDGGNVSGFAREAMQWAVRSGIIRGNADGTLSPQGGTDRAACATMLERFMDEY